MPTSAQIDAARNSIAQSLNSLKPISPEVVELALLSLIADNASGGGSSSTVAVIKTAPTNPAQFNAIAASAGSNIKNTAGSVYSLSCINQNASIRYIQLFNKASAPATNDVPIESFAVYGSGGQLILGQDYFTLNGLDFATGISWGISTTPNAYTAATASDTIFTARYL